jgi:hypothetical protein
MEENLSSIRKLYESSDTFKKSEIIILKNNMRKYLYFISYHIIFNKLEYRMNEVCKIYEELKIFLKNASSKDRIIVIRSAINNIRSSFLNPIIDEFIFYTVDLGLDLHKNINIIEKDILVHESKLSSIERSGRLILNDKLYLYITNKIRDERERDRNNLIDIIKLLKTSLLICNTSSISKVFIDIDAIQDQIIDYI